MSQFFESACRPDVAAGALGQYLRVKTPGALVLAGAADSAYGITEFAVFAAGPITVRLRNAQGTRKMVAAGAITAGNTVYGAANGEIAATGTVIEGIALEAATNAGDIIEVAPGVGQVAPIQGLASGLKVAYGHTATVTASDTIVTGLTTVLAVVACLDSDPVDNPEWVSASIGNQTGAPAAGSFLLKTWQNTSGSDPTPVAAGVFGKNVNWIAIGN